MVYCGKEYFKSRDIDSGDRKRKTYTVGGPSDTRIPFLQGVEYGKPMVVTSKMPTKVGEYGAVGSLDIDV